MAKGWILQSSISRSSKIRQLFRPGPLDPIRVYCFLRATVDNWGMMPGDQWTLKAELGSYDDYHTPKEYRKAIEELIRVGLVFQWEHQGNPWLYVIGHDELNGQYLRKRKGSPRVPRPDPDAMMAESGRHRGGNRDAIVAPDSEPMDANVAPMDRDRDREGEGETRARACEDPPPSPPSQKTDTDNRTGRGSEVLAPPVAPPVRSDPRADGVVDSMPGSSPGDQGSNPCRPVSSTQPNPGGADPPAPGARAGVSSVSEVLEEVLPQLGPAIIPDSRPTTEQHLEIHELLAEYQRAWGLEMPPIFPTHDHRRRVMEALNALGFERCKLAIHGHHREASKDGSNYGRDFIHVFPPASTGGHRQKNRCDLNRVDAFASKVRGPARRRDPPEKPRPQRDDNVNAAGLQRVREELAKRGASE